MTPEQMLLDLRIRREEYLLHLEEPFAPVVAAKWFDVHDVIPSQPHLLASERLGPRWYLADLTKCFYEWDAYMASTESNPAYEDVGIFRAVSTAFGASVVMSCLIQVQPDWDLAHDEQKPADDIETLLDAFWDTGDKMHELAPTIALRAAINMFRMSDDG